MSAMRGQALKEPVVDFINHSSVVSNFCPILDINLLTVTADELAFRSTYKLHITRRDIIDALVGWFEVGFFHCHRPIVLSTSPRSAETHWKHVVFYIDQPITVNAGDTLEGSIAVRQNTVHKRELDIKLSFHVRGEFPVDTWQYYRLR